jgi:hypothetical protein
MANLPENPTRSKLRTPRGAAIAGIAFSLLLSASLVLLRLTSPNEAGEWAANRGWALGLHLMPFAGIAFLWFIGVLRHQIGAHEDRFFATALLGSGLLFLAMLFAAAAVAGGLATSTGTVSTSLIQYSRQITYSIMNIYAMRMAAVFMLSTSTILLRTAVLPRWLTYVGYAFAIVLLVTLTLWEWILFLFPLWVFLLSVTILVTKVRASRV